MDLAQGEYIAWQDSDDISYPDRLLKQVDFLDNNQDISAVSSFIETFPNGKIIKQPNYPKMIDFLGGCVFSQPACMLRINDFKKNNLFYKEELKTSEDYDLWARAVKVLNFANIQEPLVKYRKNPNSLYHTSNKLAEEIDINIKKDLSEFLIYDKTLQKNILEIVSKHYRKKDNILEKIFSVKNEWHGFEKCKVLTIFGIKILLHKRKTK